MKKLALLFTAFICLAFTANVLGQGNLVEVPGTKLTTWGTHNHPHVVSLGSTFEYQVEKHTTLSFEDLKKKLAGKDYTENPNRYVWELYSVDYSEATKTYTTLTNVAGFNGFMNDGDARFTEATNNLGINSYNHKWNSTDVSGLVEGGYYLVRVSEYANHNLDSNTSSETADKNTEVVSEIIVKIGEELQIFMLDKENTDYYYCAKDGSTPSPADIDTEAGKIGIRLNGRPGASGDAFENGFDIKVNVSMTKGDGTTSTEDVVFSLTDMSVLTYDETTGYYSYEFGLFDINDKLATKFDLDASTMDIYYEVKVVGFRHGDSVDGDADGKIDWTDAVVDAGKNKKDTRVYGFYTKPVITQINHK